MSILQTTHQTTLDVNKLFEAFSPESCKDYLKIMFHSLVESEDFTGFNGTQRSNILSFFINQYEVYCTQKNMSSIIDNQ